MANGVRTNDVSNKVAVADEFIVNRDGSTGLQTFDELSLQLAGTGPLSAIVQNVGDAIKIAKNVTSLLASTLFSFTVGLGVQVAVGDIIQTREEGYAYRVVSAIDTAYHVVTAGGIRLLALPDGDGKLTAKQVGATGDGTTNDAPAINRAMGLFDVVGSTTAGTFASLTMYRGWLHFEPGTYRFQDKVSLKAGVGWTGTPFQKRYFTRGLEGSWFGSTILLDVTGEHGIEYVGTYLTFSGLRLENLIFTQTTKTRVAGYNGIHIVGCAGGVLKHISLYKMGFDAALKLGGSTQETQCNAMTLDDVCATYNGDANFQTTQPAATGFTYGDAVDATYCFDSHFNDLLIETNGGVGLTVSGGNNAVSNSFIDLNKHGILCTGGDRLRITNVNTKWNWVHGIYIFAALERALLSTITSMGNNYRSSTSAGDIGAGLRLAAEVNDFLVSNCDFIDDYESTGHAAYKSVRQVSVSLGSAAGTQGSFVNCQFSDDDAGWDPDIQAANGLLGLATLITSGAVAFNDCRFEDGRKSGSFLFTAAATDTDIALAGVLERSNAYGGTAGYIPLYDGSNEDLFAKEIGVFQPTVTCGSGSVTLASGEDYLSYCREGAMMHIQGQLGIASVSTPSGTLRIGNLPIPTANLTGNAGISVPLIRASGLASAINVITGRIVESASAFAVEEFEGNTIVDAFASKLQAGTKLAISMSYRVA